MKWTKEPPKLNGFYWIRYPREGMRQELVTIVEIDNSFPEYGPIHFIGNEFPSTFDELKDVEWWSQKIQEPQVKI